MPIESKELYRQGRKEEIPANETTSVSQMLLSERTGSSRVTTPRPPDEENAHKYSSGSSLKRNTYSLLKQNESRSNTRNQSAISSKIVSTSTSNVSSCKLTHNMIANIFEDFFLHTNDLLN
jgi:hypothetical protein